MSAKNKKQQQHLPDLIMAKRERWYFTKQELENSPSRRCGIDAEKELSHRQQAANLIQDMGQKLKLYVLMFL